MIELYERALASTDEAGRAFLREFMELAIDIEIKIRSISRTASNCNVILARTIDRLVRFEATGPQTDA